MAIATHAGGRLASPSTALRARPIHGRQDNLALAVVLAIFALVSLLTVNRLPYPWVDEVLLAEPGINLATGHGFTSAAWLTSTSQEIFPAPQPLYCLFIAGWVKVFGVSQTAVRTAALFLAAAGVAVLWVAVRRLGILETTRSRVWLAALVFCDYGYAFSYRGGRSEALAVLICALMLLSFSWRSALWRSAALFTGAVLVPGVGFQVVAFCLIFGCVLCVSRRGQVAREAVVVGLGLAVGMTLFIGSYRLLGVWPGFTRELQLHGSANLFERVWSRLTMNPINNHHHNLPKDLSLLFLGAAVVVITCALARRRQLTLTSSGGLGLLTAILLPAGLYLGVSFSTYYSWMVFVPLAVIYLAIWSRPGFAPVGGRFLVPSLLTLTCLVGLPLHLALAAYDWQERDPEPVERFVERVIRPDDVVLCDWTAYYAAKLRAKQVYLPMYLIHMDPAELAAVSVALVNPHQMPGLAISVLDQMAVPSDHWVKTGEAYRPARPGALGNDYQFGYLSLPNYTLEVYRKTPAPSVFSEEGPAERAHSPWARRAPASPVVGQVPDNP